MRQRTRLKNQVQAILHRNLVPRCPAADLFGRKGRAWLAEQELPADERQAVGALLRQLDFHAQELGLIDAALARIALDCEDTRRLMTIPGVDVVVAMSITAAVGDFSRFASPNKLVRYVGLNPRVKQSGGQPASHGRITKQGRAHARGMLVEAAWVAVKTQGRHEPILDEATWRRTRSLREAQHANTPRGGRHANAHLLGHGLLRCTCRASMYPRKDTRSGRDTYRCRGRDERTSLDCTMPPLPRDAVDGAVRAYLARDILSPGLIRGDLKAEAKQAAKDARRDAAAADREADKQEKRLRRLQLEWLDGAIPRGEYESLRADLEAQLTSARARRVEARRVAEAIQHPTADLLEAVESIRRAAAEAHDNAEGIAAQQAALARIFERFELLAVPLEESSAVSPEDTAAQEVAELGLPAELAPKLAKGIRDQRAELDRHSSGPGTFDVHPRGGPALRCMMLPVPREEVAARYGLDDTPPPEPWDSLRELHPISRKGLPIR